LSVIFSMCHIAILTYGLGYGLGLETCGLGLGLGLETRGLGLGLGIETCGLGLRLGLKTCGLGLGLGLETRGLGVGKMVLFTSLFSTVYPLQKLKVNQIWRAIRPRTTLIFILVYVRCRSFKVTSRINQLLTGFRQLLQGAAFTV